MNETIPTDIPVPESSGVHSEQPSTEVPPEQPPQANPEVVSFYARYKTAMLEWTKKFGNTNFPVVETKEGKLKWVNRTERRKLEKKMKKGIKVDAL